MSFRSTLLHDVPSVYFHPTRNAAETAVYAKQVATGAHAIIEELRAGAWVVIFDSRA